MNMKCPYAVDRHCVTQTHFEYDENGAEAFRQTADHSTAIFMDCLQENCGAWQDGRCRYNAGE